MREQDHEAVAGDKDDTVNDLRCPVCGGVLQHEKCKLVCRSEACVYRIVFNCSEF